jgi:hypothetical protein
MYCAVRRTRSDKQIIDTWSKKEEEVAMNLRNQELRAQYEEEVHPTRKPLHKFFVLISIVAGIAAFSMCLGQFLGIIFQQVGPVQYVLRVYVIILCILIVLNELEWTKYTKESKIMRIWITRGLFYSFIGVLGLEENDTSSSRNSNERGFNFSLSFIKVVAWVMVCCGALYFFMGIFCLQLVYNRMRTEYEQRLTSAVDVQRTAETYIEQPETGTAV